jgi:hypothetical protein
VGSTKKNGRNNETPHGTRPRNCTLQSPRGCAEQGQVPNRARADWTDARPAANGSRRREGFGARAAADHTGRSEEHRPRFRPEEVANTGHAMIEPAWRVPGGCCWLGVNRPATDTSARAKRSTVGGGAAERSAAAEGVDAFRTMEGQIPRVWRGSKPNIQQRMWRSATEVAHDQDTPHGCRPRFRG